MNEHGSARPDTRRTDPILERLEAIEQDLKKNTRITEGTAEEAKAHTKQLEEIKGLITAWRMVINIGKGISWLSSHMKALAAWIIPVSAAYLLVQKWLGHL